MKVVKLVSLLLFVLSLNVFSQTPKNCKSVKSNTIIQIATSLYNEDKFDASIAELSKVPLGDSLYQVAQYEMALSYFQLKNYQKTIDICLYLTNHTSVFLNNILVLTLLANSYSDSENYPKALEYYNEGLKAFPYSSTLHYNKGVVYVKMEQYDNAINCFKEAIFCRPNHQGSHYQLGMTYLKIGKTIPAILALNYAVTIYPIGFYSLNSLQLLDEIYKKGIDNYNKDITISDQVATENARFNTVTALINSCFALNNKYNCYSKINHAIIRQNQLLFEVIEADTNSTEIYDVLYIPFFKHLLNKKQFNIYSYYLLMGTDIDNNRIQQKALKMDKEMTLFVSDFVNFTKTIVEKGINRPQNDSMTYQYFDNIASLQAFGKYYLSKNEIIKNGEWTFIGSEGNIEEKREYKNNVVDGLLYQYGSNGKIAYQLPISNDKINGIGKKFFENTTNGAQILELEIEYKNGEANGIKRVYNFSGSLIEEATLNNNYYHGEVKTYDERGRLISSTIYSRGKYSGLSKEYYANGVMKSLIDYSKNNIKNDLFFYYPSGEIYTDGYILNNNRIGEWRYFFSNGKIERILSYNENGKENGKVISYFENGNIYTEYYSDNGVQNGDFNVYHHNGKLKIKYVYQNNLITEIQLFNPDGSIKETVLPINNIFTYNLFDQDGNITELISHTNNHTMVGKRYQYYPNGQIKEEAEYLNNELNGTVKTYYMNGNKKSYDEYKNSFLNGLSINYYQSGEIQNECYYTNNEPEGAYYAYYLNGNIERLSLHHKGIIKEESNYFPNGKIMFNTLFYNNSPYIFTTYNHQEEIIKIDTIHNGKGVFKNYYLNGSVSKTMNVMGGLFQDTTIEYDFLGNVLSKTQIINSLINGLYTSYSVFNKIDTEGNYILGKRQGDFKYFYMNGNLKSTIHYENDVASGDSYLYYTNGDVYVKRHFINDAVEGLCTYYAHDNVEVIRLNYHNGYPISYAYRDKNNKMTEFAPIGKGKIDIVAYYPNGNKALELSFNNGVYDGKATAYYSNGKISSINNYVDGNYEGEYLTFYENGNPELVIHYNQNELNGKYEWYYDNNVLAYQVDNYFYGIPHGKAIMNDNTGKLIKSADIFYGKIINEIKY